MERSFGLRTSYGMDLIESDQNSSAELTSAAVARPSDALKSGHEATASACRFRAKLRSEQKKPPEGGCHSNIVIKDRVSLRGSLF
jgi:hypothetical protein